MKIIYYYLSQIGYFKIEIEDNKIITLSKVKEKGENIGNSPLLKKTIKQLDEYFSGKRKKFTLPYKLNGTNFQKRVWSELEKIPYGETNSYKEIAIKVGSPKAYRAVGSANHNNPVAIIIPCHRVIGSNNKLVGYGGGIEVKEKLLELEKINR